MPSAPDSLIAPADKRVANLDHAAAPWRFAVAAVPSGCSALFTTMVNPYFLRLKGMSVEAIGWYNLASTIPYVLLFLYIPLLAVKLRKQQWLVLLTLSSVLPLAVLVYGSVSQYALLLFCAALSQTLVGLSNSCLGGMISMIRDDTLRDKAASGLNIGYFSGGGLGATILFEVIKWRGTAIAALAASGMLLLALLARPSVGESAPKPNSLVGLYKDLLHETRSTLRLPSQRFVLLICILPCGTAALSGYFGTLAVEYKVTAQEVALFNNFGNIVMTVLGAIIFNRLCEKTSRQRIYLWGCASLAVLDALLALLPTYPATFALGALSYSLLSGIIYSSLQSIVVTVDEASQLSQLSSRYAILLSLISLNAAVICWLCNRAHAAYGHCALFAAEATIAGLGLLGVLVFLSANRRVSGR